MKRPKYSQNFERDYNFYLQNAHKFSFAPFQPVVLASEHGHDAKYCFWKWDSTGKVLPCREPELLSELMICKKSIGFHLKMWAEGFDDFCEPINYYLAEFIDPPDWVVRALTNLFKKRHRG